MSDLQKFALIVSILGLVCLADWLTYEEPKAVNELGEHQQANRFMYQYTHKSVIALEEMGE